MHRIIIKPGAYDMLGDAYLWYEAQLPGLGERLLAEVDAKLDKLKHAPHHSSFIATNYRHIILGNFPYKIVYEISGMDVIVYAFFHTSRNPDKMLG